MNNQRVWNEYLVLELLPGTFPDLVRATGLSLGTIRSIVYVLMSQKPKRVFIGAYVPKPTGGIPMAVFHKGDSVNVVCRLKPTKPISVDQAEAARVRMRKLRAKYKAEGRKEPKRKPKLTKEEIFMEKVRVSGPANPFFALFQLQEISDVSK